MVQKEKRKPSESGKNSYETWKAELFNTPGFAEIYAEEAAKSELWLQLVEARQAAGLTKAEMALHLGVSQAQVARIEKRGYDAYTLNTLRKYVAALGEGFTLQVAVHTPQEREQNITVVE